jgi:hypothetical protein
MKSEEEIVMKSDAPDEVRCSRRGSSDEVRCSRRGISYFSTSDNHRVTLVFGEVMIDFF